MVFKLCKILNKKAIIDDLRKVKKYNVLNNSFQAGWLFLPKNDEKINFFENNSFFT